MSQANTPKSTARTSPSSGSSLQRLLLMFAGLALGYIVLLSYLHYQSRMKVAQIFGGPTGVTILKNADKIEAYRLGNLADNVDDRYATFSDYPIQRGPVPVSPGAAQILVETLLDEGSYYWNARKACIPIPGVRIDFIRGDDRLSLLICYECKILRSYRNGKIVGGRDFDYSQPILVRLAHTLFPDDPKIKALTEEPFTPPHD